MTDSSVSHPSEPHHGVPDPSAPNPHATSRSLAAHLLRGVVGFGLIGSTFALIPTVGAPALLLFAPGFVALRGCPTCWILGLIQTVSAGRVQGTCTVGGCAPLRPPRQAPPREQ
ncbi:MAG TPA: hypothetical protein VGI24_01460 [Solirubrobacteraceae bacterium]